MLEMGSSICTTGEQVSDVSGMEILQISGEEEINAMLC